MQSKGEDNDSASPRSNDSQTIQIVINRTEFEERNHNQAVKH